MFDTVQHTLQRHQEDPFIDFYYERGVPMMLSHEGPRAAYGDVNGDGLPDLFICGAARQPAQLYLQTQNGFVKKEQEIFQKNAEKEGVTALFFDADGDKDLDLILGTGGNRFPANHAGYSNILYRNDGKGNFSWDETALPASGMNTACITANDIDNDGDLDLFVGSRSVPHKYGVSPPSFLYRNNGSGKFEDVTSSVFPQAKTLGLVTAAVWTDIDKDKKEELVVVGEWSHPRIFSVTNSRIHEMQTNLTAHTGWWKTVKAADLDHDGDMDLVLGNVGENFYLSPTADKPVKMFLLDFDGNGTLEKIITSTIEGKDKPVFVKKDLTDQIASLRKQNLKYADYADKAIGDLFTPEQLQKAELKIFTYPSSAIAWNNGAGNFTVQKLPATVQLSCVNAITLDDINNDGLTDILLAGNEFNYLPQFSQLDASYGHVLLNKGNRTFLPVEGSGIDVRGEVKDIINISTKDEQRYLFLQNNARPVIYRRKLSLTNK